MTNLAPDVQERFRKIRQDKEFHLPPSPLLREQIEVPGRGLQPFRIRPYQNQMIAHLALHPRFIVGDDVGTGKTISTIGALSKLWDRDPQLKVLICTTKSTAKQWESELRRFLKDVNVFVAVGTATKRKTIQEKFIECARYAVLVYTYGSLTKDFTSLQTWEGFLLICDEATAFKESKTQIHQIIRHLSERAYRAWGLTATLIRNNLYEGYGVFRCILPGLFPDSASRFIAQYCLTQLIPIGRGRKAPRIVGYAPDQVEAFKERIEPYYLGRSKRDVAHDLPQVIPVVIEIPLTSPEWDLYREARAGTLQVGTPQTGTTTAPTKMTILIRCQQVVNHPGLIGSEVESSKLNLLLEYLTEGDLANPQVQVIVFSRFKQLVIDHIEPALRAKHISVCRITGDDDSEERERSKLSFQTGKSKVILITSAGGEGVNLQAASVIVFFDSPWSAGEYAQVIGRMCRIGSIHDRVVAIHLVARPPTTVRTSDTIDSYTMKVLQTKMDLFEKVLDRKIHDAPMGLSDQTDPLNQRSMGSEMDMIFDHLLHDAGDEARDPKASLTKEVSSPIG